MISIVVNKSSDSAAISNTFDDGLEGLAAHAIHQLTGSFRFPHDVAHVGRWGIAGPDTFSGGFCGFLSFEQSGIRRVISDLGETFSNKLDSNVFGLFGVGRADLKRAKMLDLNNTQIYTRGF